MMSSILSNLLKTRFSEILPQIAKKIKHDCNNLTGNANITKNLDNIQDFFVEIDKKNNKKKECSDFCK